MLGFENFDLTAWADNGLTFYSLKSKVATEYRRQSTSKEKVKRTANTIGWKSAISAALLSFGMIDTLAANEISTYSQVILPTEQIATTGLRPVGERSNTSEVPPNYWGQLISEMNTWERLTETAHSIPPALI